MKLIALVGILCLVGCSAYSQPGPYRPVKTGPDFNCSMDPPNQPDCP